MSAAAHFDDAGHPTGKGWDEFSFPAVNDEHAYALQIAGSDMAPVFRNGDIILVSPAAPIRRGDRVVIKTKDGRVKVHEMKRRCSKSVELRSLGSARKVHTVPTRDVVWLARIVWASQ